MLCYVMLCYAMLCYVMLCYVMSFPGPLLGSEVGATKVHPHRINRGSTANRPVIVFPVRSTYNFFCLSFQRDVQTVVLDTREGKEIGYSLGEPSCRRFVLPGPAQTGHPAVPPLVYGKFSTFQVCFCSLDPGNLKSETVRTHKQRICFQDLRRSIGNFAI